MSFVDIPNTTQEVRGIIYDIFATYNIILLDRKHEPVLNIIREEYNYLELPDLDDKKIKIKLSSLFENEWSVSLEEVIKECKKDDIFLGIVKYLDEER
ncbi:hypothetical protein JFL43_04260 [Viridibacillus sp. YIM B01967]|uniref:Uncharacterized protein n=1 Tax=Viridibacillus soli TaxID=2798301 RepID=A0ABS1H3V3_9BACL|nr:hypothetical protein [Viridibacillus soli]MBK3494083.1 hypothetical protein [Viridibacillus soli]